MIKIGIERIVHFSYVRKAWELLLSSCSRETRTAAIWNDEKLRNNDAL